MEDVSSVGSSSVTQQVTTSVLKKSLDNQEQQAASLFQFANEGSEAVQQSSSGSSSTGNNVDVIV